MGAMQFEPIDEATEQLITAIIDSSFRVYTTLGPGLLESVYETCLCQELSERKIQCDRQVRVPIIYNGVELQEYLRIDILVAQKIIVEIKAVEDILPVFQSQLITYLKLTKNRIGLLINFNVPTFKGAVKRIIL
ncbi:MAG: GxxExxY protein [Bacteroidota bacterium]